MCLCHFEMISDNPSAINLVLNVQISERKLGFALGKLHAHSSHFSMVTCVCMWKSPFDSIGSNGSKEMSIIKIDQWVPEKRQIRPDQPK